MKSKPKKESDINKDNLVMTKDKYLVKVKIQSWSSIKEEQVEVKKEKVEKKLIL